jgi:hypothetical protein
MNPDYNELKRQLDALLAWKASLEASYSIPLNIDQSFRGRFQSTTMGQSTKLASSEDRLVQEGGTQQYNVLTTPDAFLQVIINNTTYYIPAFT